MHPSLLLLPCSWMCWVPIPFETFLSVYGSKWQWGVRQFFLHLEKMEKEKIHHTIWKSSSGVSCCARHEGPHMILCWDFASLPWRCPKKKKQKKKQEVEKIKKSHHTHTHTHRHTHTHTHTHNTHSLTLTLTHIRVCYLYGHWTQNGHKPSARLAVGCRTTWPRMRLPLSQTAGFDGSACERMRVCFYYFFLNAYAKCGHTYTQHTHFFPLFLHFFSSFFHYKHTHTHTHKTHTYSANNYSPSACQPKY